MSTSGRLPSADATSLDPRYKKKLTRLDRPKPATAHEKSFFTQAQNTGQGNSIRILPKKTYFQLPLVSTGNSLRSRRVQLYQEQLIVQSPNVWALPFTSFFSPLTDVVQQIVRYCCNGSKIVYGRFLKSIREAEDHFSEQMYDFTFPVYVSKMDKDLYKDQPFVAVVAAPRVMLLVYDSPQVTWNTVSLL